MVTPGGLAERPIALALKASDAQASGGSNPSPSAQLRSGGPLAPPRPSWRGSRSYLSDGHSEVLGGARRPRRRADRWAVPAVGMGDGSGVDLLRERYVLSFGARPRARGRVGRGQVLHADHRRTCPPGPDRGNGRPRACGGRVLSWAVTPVRPIAAGGTRVSRHQGRSRDAGTSQPRLRVSPVDRLCVLHRLDGPRRGRLLSSDSPRRHCPCGSHGGCVDQSPGTPWAPPDA